MTDALTRLAARQAVAFDGCSVVTARGADPGDVVSWIAAAAYGGPRTGTRFLQRYAGTVH